MEIKELKERATIFLKNDCKICIKDIYNNFYFAKIMAINKDWLYVSNFSGNR